MVKRSPKTHKQLKKEVLGDAVGRSEYDAFKLQLDIADELKHARQASHLTQEAIAERMDTKKSVIARLEAAGGRGKHSPSLNTLVKYANAVGYMVNITLRPKNKRKAA